MADEPIRPAAPPAPQPAPQKSAAPAPQSDNDEAPVVGTDQSATIETWFRDHFNGGSPLAATTDLYNAGYAAKEDLKKRLAS